MALPEDGRLRVDLFSDAVFAVAITLLVLDLPLAGTSGSLLDALAARWAAFSAFGISFVIVGCLWVSHFRLFRMVEDVDGPLLFLNLALLLSIVLIPFGAATMSSFVTQPGAQSHLAAALFAGILVMTGLTFGALYALVNRRAPRWHRISTRRWSTIRAMAGLVVTTMAVGVAFISPIAVLVMTGAVSIYYIVDQLMEKPEHPDRITGVWSEF